MTTLPVQSVETCDLPQTPIRLVATDLDGTLLDFHGDEVQARQSIVANARIAVLVADTTKFGRNATVRGGHLDDCHHLFTDGPLPPAFAPIATNYADRIHAGSNARAEPEQLGQA